MDKFKGTPEESYQTIFPEDDLDSEDILPFGTEETENTTISHPEVNDPPM